MKNFYLILVPEIFDRNEVVLLKNVEKESNEDCKSGLFLLLTGKTKHRDTPPYAPAPSDKAKQDGEELTETNDQVYDQTTDSCCRFGGSRKTRLTGT